MTKYKSFPHEFWVNISTALDATLRTDSRPIAAFDADGTLWDTDLGENFFRWQIKNCNLPNLPPDPWKHYRDMKASGDPRPAYLWLAQINQGQTIHQVRQWAQQAIEPVDRLPLFEEQKKLIQWLHSKGIQVYVITASVKWAVEPGAALFGIPADNVLGVSTKIDSKGLVTAEQEGLITYREGKPASLKARTGKSAFFASGNTMGDFSLLESATQMRLAVGATGEGHELFKTEEELRQNAKTKNWLWHLF